jgi:ribosomal protein S18 acetylase RimI-like enzyme
LITVVLVHVEEVLSVDDELIEAFVRLTPQLSSSAPAPGAAELEAIVASEASHLLVVRDDDGRIYGTTTLVVFRIPTGVRGWIEDVVVDGAPGRGGAGKALTTFALDLARSLGVKTVDLTSRPSREVANGMYQKLGFQQRETNVYRFSLE